MTTLVETARIDDVWPEVAPLLLPVIGLPACRHTLDGVLEHLKSGHMQLFIERDGDQVIAAAVTQVMVYSGGEWLTVVLCGGTGLEDWGEDGIRAIEKWAERCGCGGVEIIGRPGWAMALPGYERVAAVVQRRF